MKLPSLSLAVFLALAPFAAVVRAEIPASLPAAPADLLQVLPQPPEGWGLSQSTAQSTSGAWVQTRAVRVYQAPPNATGAPIAGSVEIAVVDTAGFRQSLGDFIDFKPGKLGPLERLLIAGYPALQIPDAEGNLHTQILLASRYIVEFKIVGLPTEKVESWLRTLRFDTLPRRSSDTKAALPSEVTLSSIDELHPERNRSYSAPFSSDAAKAFETAPAP